jgi:hypothetical protein
MSPVERAWLSELEAEVRRLRMENEFLKKAALGSIGRCNTCCLKTTGMRSSVSSTLLCGADSKTRCPDLMLPHLFLG